MTSQRKVLITGAAGRIGSFITRPFREFYELALTDIRQPEETFGLPFTQADIADIEALRSLCSGVDTVVHLGADPSMQATWESLLPRNVVGVYNVFQAAHEANCRRVIFASSVNAVGGYPRDLQVHTDMPVRPPNLYGATKAWGEAAGRFYADQCDLSVICLRFGAVQPRENARPGAPWLDTLLTYEDLTRLVQCAIDAPDDLRFGIFHGVSNNRYKRLDITDARQILGYDPQDDGFALAEQAHEGAS